ncbi:hypothetical protein AVEN_245919-1 [Araneus ventricosus]|uniref:Uncharacterized protein n=1 Tax=Araneus ventricosus TaxID=182803 RepID=A0A4Y2N8U8_ARAVE|nr:hypothetical protein AVEN_245919-1 [Araneus ventricosus]
MGYLRYVRCIEGTLYMTGANTPSQQNKAGHSRERKAKPFVPATGLYYTYFRQKIGKSFTDVPMFLLRQGSKSQNSPTHPPPHGRFQV